MGDYYNNASSLCPAWASLLGFGGCVVAVVFASEFKFIMYRTRELGMIECELRCFLCTWKDARMKGE